MHSPTGPGQTLPGVVVSNLGEDTELFLNGPYRIPHHQLSPDRHNDFGSLHNELIDEL